MSQVLIVGADTMVGANWIRLAGENGKEHSHGQLVGLPGATPADHLRQIVGHTASAAKTTASPVRRVVHCGAAGANGWSIRRAENTANSSEVEKWARLCAEYHIPMTLISSDAIFTGPWMFHSESSESFCESSEAQTLRQMEAAVLAASASHLIIRTHPFGWHTGDGGMEECLETIRSQSCCQIDGTRHASPIFVNDLISIVQRAWSSGLSGTYHVAGAERVSHAQFIQRLAQTFGLNLRRMTSGGPLEARATGFASGETSLQTRKIRRAIGIPMPMLHEGLAQFARQPAAAPYVSREFAAA
jgi:dTDP-4-dehydrorhamnose reductase